MENSQKLLHSFILAAVVILNIFMGISFFCGISIASKIEQVDSIFIDAMRQVKPKLDMPPVVFLHDKHTDLLISEGHDCTLCHDNTSKRPFAFLPHQAGITPKELEEKYHEVCIGCHVKRAEKGLQAGPLTGECRTCHNSRSEYIPTDKTVPMGSKSLHYLHVCSKEITYPGSQENCGACHHVYDAQQKKLVWEKGKEDACAACHGEHAEGNKPSLQTAVHTKCVGCHLSLKTTEKVSTDKNTQGEKSSSLDEIDVDSPTRCAGCHTAEAQRSFIKFTDVPRLMRGQPDTTVILPVTTIEERHIKSPRAGMNPVLFNHKVHEGVVDSCRTCHHIRIGSCTDCHTIEGKKEGNYVTLAEAMHSKTSERSCIGCHQQRVMQEKECAGCHGFIQPMQSCSTCHTELTGLSLRQIPDGAASQLSQKQLAMLANIHIEEKQQHVQPLSPLEIPETVTISILSHDYEPSIMPHRKIYEALLRGIENNGLAAAFHTSPTAVCAACHHHSPKESLRNPPKCAGCHSSQADRLSVENNRPSLKAAYHQQCMTCHERMQIKPVATDCTGCHAISEK